MKSLFWALAYKVTTWTTFVYTHFGQSLTISKLFPFLSVVYSLFDFKKLKQYVTCLFIDSSSFINEQNIKEKKKKTSMSENSNFFLTAGVQVELSKHIYPDAFDIRVVSRAFTF